MLIYTKHITPRLEYTLKYVFTDCLHINYNVTGNTEEFEAFSGYKINYSELPLSAKIQVLPNPLLFEQTITDEKPQVSSFNGIPVLFPQPESTMGFDIFAAIFWMLSRYEEYQPFKPDVHKRFPGSESLAFKNGFHELPVVDSWIVALRKVLQTAYPNIELNLPVFRVKTTIDVDSPWCYKNKGIFRLAAGLGRDMLRGNYAAVGLRIKVLCGFVPDPWFVFDRLQTLFQNNSNELMFFMHVGNYGAFDKSTSYRHKSFKSLINRLEQNFEIGLHPSYASSDNPTVFAEELGRLNGLTQNAIYKSRQHYLKFTLPEYYRMLLELGITHDYSMGFADMPGFRAGTGNSFLFFDLLQNKETILTVHPFAVMDRTLQTYLNQSPEKALNTLKKIMQNVKTVNGTFVSLWHNESLSDTFEWKGWSAVFNEFIQYRESLK